MRFIAKSRLLARAEEHGDCVTQIQEWCIAARNAQWHDLSEVRQTYRYADVVGDKTVFKIKGNHYRLIVHINYETGIIYFKDLLTHAEYDKGHWKE